MEEEKKTTRKRIAKDSNKKITKALPKKTIKEGVVETISKVSGQKINALPLVFVLIVAILGLLGYLFRDRIFAATINGKPVFRYELNQRMTKSFGKEVLENLIVEKLIAEEAAKNNIVVTQQEIDDEVSRLSENLGPDTKLEDVLSFQGMTLEDLKEQLRLKIQVNKILNNEVAVSDEEIEDFVKNNAQMLSATDSGEQKNEARSLLMEQKINQAFGTWIDEAIKNSKITRYLN
ncbi:SurA N-terminal domain-containing protein [Patescibacteria group bacterium]|nr:SurA N-terminal domain-containing protein [Patescibacteria group bacterium]